MYRCALTNKVKKKRGYSKLLSHIVIKLIYLYFLQKPIYQSNQSLLFSICTLAIETTKFNYKTTKNFIWFPKNIRICNIF